MVEKSVQKVKRYCWEAGIDRMAVRGGSGGKMVLSGSPCMTGKRYGREVGTYHKNDIVMKSVQTGWSRSRHSRKGGTDGKAVFSEAVIYGMVV